MTPINLKTCVRIHGGHWSLKSRWLNADHTEGPAWYRDDNYAYPPPIYYNGPLSSGLFHPNRFYHIGRVHFITQKYTRVGIHFVKGKIK